MITHKAVRTPQNYCLTFSLKSTEVPDANVQYIAMNVSSLSTDLTKMFEKAKLDQSYVHPENTAVTDMKYYPQVCKSVERICPRIHRPVIGVVGVKMMVEMGGVTNYMFVPMEINSPNSCVFISDVINKADTTGMSFGTISK